MTRKDLFDYKYLKIRLNTYLDQYKEKFEAVTNITAKIDGLPKGRNKPNYSLEEFIDSSNELIRLYNEETKKEKELLLQLQKLDNEKYRTVLYLRYIVYCYEKNPLELTAAKMNYDYYETCKFNGKALNEFDKLDKQRQDNTKKI